MERDMGGILKARWKASTANGLNCVKLWKVGCLPRVLEIHKSIRGILGRLCLISVLSPGNTVTSSWEINHIMVPHNATSIPSSSISLCHFSILSANRDAFSSVAELS